MEYCSIYYKLLIFFYSCALTIFNQTNFPLSCSDISFLAFTRARVGQPVTHMRSTYSKPQWSNDPINALCTESSFVLYLLLFENPFYSDMSQ